MPTLTLMAAEAVHHVHDHDGWDRPGFWPIFPILWAAVIVTVAVLLFRRRRAWGGPCHGGAGVLAERYARGEIDDAEYRARRDVLREKK